jgi:hypothetical protein
MNTTTIQPLDIGTVRAALRALGLRKAHADKLIMLALEAGADETEQAMIIYCLRAYGGKCAN